MLRHSPNHGTQRLPNDDDDDPDFGWGSLVFTQSSNESVTLDVRSRLETFGPVDGGPSSLDSP